MSLQAEYGLGVSELCAMSKRGEKIACLTAYDASFAQVLDQAGVKQAIFSPRLHIAHN